jgi:endonuclease/exonuclease/phosphatase family metal-dependent hydrolase
VNLCHNAIATLTHFTDASDPSNEFVVCGTHLKAKSGNEKQRAEQIAQLLEVLKQQQHPIVLAGDFNDTPESPVLSLLLKGEATIDNNIIAKNALLFRSAYDLASPTLYTTFKYRPAAGLVRRTIDYILVSDDRVQINELFEIPEPNLFPDVGLPAPNYPSDHLSIGASFQFRE